MDKLSRAKLGTIPFPYIAIIALLPLWIFFSIGEHSLLYSLTVIITTVLKGSLLSRWVIYKSVRFIQWSILVSGVIVLEIVIISEGLQISFFPLVVLVPLSTVSGIIIFLDPEDSQGESWGSTSQVIGIFSRSSEDEYNWLSATLKTAGKVVPFYITNSNFREFREQVSQCTIAILYHSKNRGRINITDVTDSLYDEEVKYMSNALGRDKVIVVVDDLEDSSYGLKNQILQSQKTIRDQTLDLYLFTKEEKQEKKQIRQILQPIMKRVSQGSSLVLTDLITAVILCAPWILYHFSVYQGLSLMLSNIGGSLLILKFLLPFTQGSLQTRLPALLLVMVVELLAAYWYYSGMKEIILASLSVATTMYAVLTSFSRAAF